MNNSSRQALRKRIYEINKKIKDLITLLTTGAEEFNQLKSQRDNYKDTINSLKTEKEKIQEDLNA